MEVFRQPQETPDLSGQLAVLSYRPAFNGPYSCIYRGKLRETGELVALKVLNALEGAALHTMQRKLERERRIWGSLDHRNILPLYGFANDEEIFQPFGALISPWLDLGDASKFLAENGHAVTMMERFDLWRDVISGVNYLHSHLPTLVHGDLKPRNILIDHEGRARICDFGLARIFLNEGSSGMTTTSHHTGTERYLAYELVLAGEDAIPSTASDMYAIGCIGLEFLFSRVPYSSRRNNLGGMIFVDIREGVRPAEQPVELPPELEPTWRQLEDCWNKSPYKRPSAAALIMWLEWEMELIFPGNILPEDGPKEWCSLNGEFGPGLSDSVQDDYQDTPDSERGTGTPDPDASSSTEGSLSPLAPYQLSFSTNHPISRFWPLIDTLEKHGVEVGTSPEGGQGILLSVLEEEFPSSVLSRINLSFRDYVAAATRQDIVITGGAGEEAWVAMKEWGFPGKSTQPLASVSGTLYNSMLPVTAPSRLPQIPRYDESWFWPLVDALEKALAQLDTRHRLTNRPRQSMVQHQLPLSALERIGLTFEEYVAIAARTGVVVVGGVGEEAWIATRDKGYPGRVVDGGSTLKAKSSTWRNMARMTGWKFD